MFNISDNIAFSNIVGHSPALESVIRTAQITAATDVHILIEGATGTGKELMAQALQKSSRRADQAFIIINCAALPEETIESALFGHEQGAFTGATERKDGYMQKAHNGTLFLDEIGELPLTQQAKLLRFVEYGECQRVGSNETEKVDVRIIAATNQNLMQEVNEGKFRQDLFYRLSVVTLRIPTLVERRGDIPELAKYFLQQASERNHSESCILDQEALSLLKHYSWPGNIRELKNVCEYVTALMPGEVIKSENLPHDIRNAATANNSATGFTLPEHGIDMQSLELDLLKQALELAEGNKSQAAKLLGLSRDAFLYRLKKHNM